ncbi:MAG: hypothetical protein ACUVUG_05285 [Candidatus Aminicenantia bacterium]
MKKLSIIFLSLFLLFVSCKRDEIVEPPMSSPSTLSYILEGNANLSVLNVSDNPGSANIRVRLYDFSGKPIAGAPIYFETVCTYTLKKITYDTYGNEISRSEEQGSATINLGFFNGNSGHYQAYTDANGYVELIYTAPDPTFYCSQTFSYQIYGPPGNQQKDEYIYNINSFFIRARWASPPNPNMFIYCDIPITLILEFSWPSFCRMIM